MQFAIIATLVATAMAVPADIAARASVCSGSLYAVAQCCAPNVLGVACLDGKAPSEVPRDANHFQQICGKTGKGAKCCVVPVAGQELLCTDV